MKKAVIITGAGSGIGRATSLLFSQQGYFVYLIGRNKQALEEVASLCRSGARRYGCDLTSSEQITKTMADILGQKDTDIQALVNNAGFFSRKPFLQSTPEDWLKMMNTNLLGPVALTQKVIPYFLEREHGSIVNVASTLGLKTAEDVSAYAASKAAMISWSQSLAIEYGKKQIRCNTVCPGIVDTPIHDFHKLPPTDKTKVLNNLSKLQPLGRIGTADEIAKAIYFLGGSESSWTTGAVLSVDGGINLV